MKLDGSNRIISYERLMIYNGDYELIILTIYQICRGWRGLDKENCKEIEENY